jgi:hypothetical protein
VLGLAAEANAASKGAADPSTLGSTAVTSRASAPAPVVSRASEPTKRAETRQRLPHRGTVIEATAGTVGCLGGLCGREDLATQPGVRAGGFFGGNIHGWVEMGVTGGWGMVATRAPRGMNALSVYGLDAAKTEASLVPGGLDTGTPDLQGLAIADARLQTAQLGPMARIHFNPRGRLLAWVGSGATYHLLRNDFATERGRLRMDFHGMAVPLEAGLGVALHRNFAVVAQFSYMWTWHFITRIRLPDEDLMLPTSMLQAQARDQGSDLVGQLPRFWTAGLGVRTRF